MARNILIFSDGTGQAGGLTPDQEVSNVYKLYRATRSDSDSSVDARKQIAFYDAGLGTAPENLGVLGRAWRRAKNLVAQALGLGIDQNIADCYAAIIRYWTPGDRIFLVGFSRGAFTARCVGGLLAHCGVPTTAPGPDGLKRDPKSANALAMRAVKIYQHGSVEAHPEADDPALRDPRRAERLRLAAEFRREHGSGSPEPGGDSNAVPYFIGVFDTVGTIANLGPLWLVIAPAALAVGALGLCWSGIGPRLLTGAPAVFFALAAGLGARLVYESRYGSENGWLRQAMARLPALKPFRFYDTQLNARVPFARHAMSIDENRDDFRVVMWDEDDDTAIMAENGARRMRQRWFAGVHSDIGGSYPEAESRLSDIALEWMAKEMKGLPDPPQFSAGRLNLSPSPLGMQHDELKAHPGLLPGARLGIERRGALDESVLLRLSAPAALHYDVTKPYRPEGLRTHPQAAEFYRDAPTSAGFAPEMI
ncbi:DUF2235 domain-containing protein [Chenggangzhangella methanolivorans]|uniref:DUF2235 domain-containing protein n=1 Tax=Chenggangzhangella methanolivorans TaxID=1437009 RepID=A0A9E6R5P1_9HYPH|nr:DUF2235 domain-containing protein [Chenggangzhangella methanolivorans]QZN98348.1 DUF2235 domain-containing protein [Chenggangzhangella methanolivorans]